jgi:5'-deoxynucleotidase YfbR-like HD superfamily hydrolase
VAQHSLVVETIFRHLNRATPDEMLAALLHDAPEYVIGDMISPFKSVVGGDYKVVEKRQEAAIYRPLAQPPHCSPELKDKIKKADTVSAYFEATLLAGFTPQEARKFFGQPRGITQEMLPMEPMPAIEAQRLFLTRVEAIEAERAAVRTNA